MISGIELRGQRRNWVNNDGFSAFLKIGDIVGESQDAVHHGEIDLLSFSFGAHQPSAASAGEGIGRVNLHDVSVEKLVDRASPILLKACCTGQHFKTAVLAARKAGAGSEDYLIVTLSDVMISSIQAARQTGSHILPT